MSIETSGFGVWVFVLIMVAVTWVTRWGGVFLMSYIPINNRVRLFINGMSSSVLVALIAPMALNGDNGARLALITTASIMLTLKKPMIAIAVGILFAALYRQFVE